jgi:two-component system, OmpR family, KDP operon response regulator KdpE
MAHIILMMPAGKIRAAIADALRASGLQVQEVSTGSEAIRRVFELRPDAVVISITTDEQDLEGLQLVRVLRAASDLPIVALTSARDPTLSVQILELGADDVVGEGAPVDELLARVNAAIRRHARFGYRLPGNAIVRTGDLVIDRGAQLVTKRGALMHLTRTEYQLLDALALRVGQVAPHRFLLAMVWGDAFVDDTHYLRIYIGYLRAKLEDDPSNPEYLINEWGLGYRLALLPVRGAPAAGPEAGQSEGGPGDPGEESAPRRPGAFSEEGSPRGPGENGHAGNGKRDGV